MQLANCIMRAIQVHLNSPFLLYGLMIRDKGEEDYGTGLQDWH